MPIRRHTIKNPYDTLGVSKTSTQDEIKDAYRKLMKETHPDVGGDQEKAKDINEAYEILSNPDKKAAYDNPPNNFQDPLNPFGSVNMEEFLRQAFGQGTTRGANSFFHFNFGQGAINPHVHVNMKTIVNQDASVPCFDLMLGTTLQVNCPSGTKKTIVIPAGTQNGTIFRITDKHLGATIHIHLRIIAHIPTLTAEQRENLKSVLNIKTETPA